MGKTDLLKIAHWHCAPAHVSSLFFDYSAQTALPLRTLLAMTVAYFKEVLNWPPVCWRYIKSLLLCGMSTQGIVK
jgi:hypothetical protein